MSIEALIALRKKRHAPAAVWVVVGAAPQRLAGLADCIEVKASPAAIDWRAVAGLHVDVFDLTGDADLLNKTIEAIEGGHPQAISVACDHGVVGLSHDHEMTLHKIRRHLAVHS